MLVVSLALLGLKVFAFVDALVHKPEEYDAAGKWNKNAWLIVLGVFLAAHLILPGPIGLLNIAGTVAALVYLVDVRPALRAVTRRR